MDALELTLRSSHLLKPPSASATPVPVSFSSSEPFRSTSASANTNQQQQQQQQNLLSLASSILNDTRLIKADTIQAQASHTKAALTQAASNRSPLRFNKQQQQQQQNPPPPPKLVLADLGNGNGDSYGNTFYDAAIEASVEAKSYSTEETPALLLMTDSDGSGMPTTNSSEDVYYDNMEDNSSNDNIEDDDKYFEDDEVDDYETTTTTTATQLQSLQPVRASIATSQQQLSTFKLKPSTLSTICKEEVASAEHSQSLIVAKETKYAPSPKEEFGEVTHLAIFHFFFDLINL
jgi:hypothetical protein